MDSENIIKYETSNVPFEGISAARDEAIASLSEPHFALGKIISKYCPEFGSAFDKNSHITAVYPVGSRGVFALGALAELVNSHLAITELPIRHEELAKFATREFLVDNATASVNGCHLIVATPLVASFVMEDLRRHNFAPERIGSVGNKGAASVAFEKDVGQYVASKAKLAKLVTTASTAQPAG
jgi:selenophosphate synthase